MRLAKTVVGCKFTVMVYGFNRLLVAGLPYLPKAAVAFFARRYVAGESVEEALAVAEGLNERGFQVTLDILGEDTQSHEEATLVASAYAHLYQELNAARIRGNISVKLTHLGLKPGREGCLDNLFQVLDAAETYGYFLRIDMEDSSCTDDTIDLYRACRERYPGVGLALQSCLHRSMADLEALLDGPLNVRICKGIYNEPAAIAHKKSRAITANFLALARRALADGAYVAIATHDQRLIDGCLNLIAELNVPNDRFEFQVLHGVPMEGRKERLLAQGCRVRVYLPFGEAWHDYALRRIKENPRIATYVLKNMLLHRRERV